MRTIKITLQIEDNDLIEFNLEKRLFSLLGDSIKEFKVIKNDLRRSITESK